MYLKDALPGQNPFFVVATANMLSSVVLSSDSLHVFGASLPA